MTLRERMTTYNPLIVSGFLLMLCGSYFDNVRGILLPIIAREMDLSYGAMSWFLITGHLAAVVAALAILRLLKATTDMHLASAACVVGFIGIILAHFVGGLPSLLLLAFVLGVAMTSMGTLSNMLTIQATPPEMITRVLSGLHIMYGLGSLVAPLVASSLLRSGLPWPWLVAAPALFLASVISLNWRLPKARMPQSRESGVTFRIRSIHIFVLLVFGFYVAGEVLTSMWMTTYLVEVRGFTVPEAGPYVAGFFAMMASTRFLSFLVARERFEVPLLWGSLAMPCLCFSMSRWSGPWILPLAGCLGPFYPVFLGRISKTFPQEWRSLTLYVVVFMQFVLGFSHFVLGNLIDRIGARQAYVLPPLLLVGCAVMLLAYLRAEAPKIITGALPEQG